MKGSFYSGKVNEINDFILSESAAKPYRNYIYFFTPSDKKKVTISCKFTDSKDYYGLNPCVTIEEIKKQLVSNKSALLSTESLKQYSEKIIADGHWSLNRLVSNEVRAGLLMKTILTLSLFFYYNISFMNESDLGEFSHIVNSENSNYTNYPFSFISNTNENIIDENPNYRIYGRLPVSIIKKLKEKGYFFEVRKGTVCISKTNESNIEALYSSEYIDYLHCTSEFLYSGVNLKLTEAKITDDLISNNNLQAIAFNIERTTFATICGFDGIVRGNTGNVSINSICHPLLKSSVKCLLDAEKNESELINNMLSDLRGTNDCSTAIERLNQYLMASIYPHNINISGNMITSDGFLIYTKRSLSTTDKNTLYCSVNGMCEVNDENVTFYTQSGTESDVPSIEFAPGIYFRTSGEICRECEEELGISGLSDKWGFYGFSIMGLKTTETSRRIESCHFNILTYNSLNYSFDEVVNSWKTATEKEENECLFGYKLTVFSNRLKLMSDNVKSSVKTILNHKDILLLLALLLSKCLSAPTNSLEHIIKNMKLILNGKIIEVLTSPISYYILEFAEKVIYILLIISAIQTLYFFLKNRKVKKTVKIVCKSKLNSQKVINKCFGKDRHSCHAILLIMSLLHYCQKEYEAVNTPEVDKHNSR